ncbi:MAG: hypothetical protein ACK52V_13665 [Betaproteobacteria bacterium]|jgi:hypothetical protein
MSRTITGTVAAINRLNGLFQVRLAGGAYAVFELVSAVDLKPGDLIAGHLDAMGSQQLLHLGHAQAFQAIGQSGEGSFKATWNLMGL